MCFNQRNHCTDYNAMHRITGGLHLGGYLAATVKSSLEECNIGTILTVMDTPIPTEHRFPGIAYHYIPAYDDEYQNLLSHFPLAYDIIDNALAASPDAGVYVHCAAGISRSATTVISYIMRNLRMPYETARALVRSRRGVIHPNPGFVRQLQLYEAMDYRLDGNNQQLRQFLLDIYADYDYSRLQRYFERLLAVERATAGGVELGPLYVCDGCGRALFNEIHVLRNEDPINGAEPGCGRVYVEPRPWMLACLTAPPNPDHQYRWLSIRCPQCAQSLVNPTSTLGSVTGSAKLNEMDRIMSALYSGGDLPVTNESILRASNIGTILTVMDTCIPNEHRFPGIAYHWISAVDDESQDLLTHFPTAYYIINDALNSSLGAGVYVHCGDGISRSATIVIAYVMSRLGVPYESARALVATSRAIIDPNVGFVRQLRLFEAMNYQLSGNDRRLRLYLLDMYAHDYSRLIHYFERLAAITRQTTEGMDLRVRYACNGCDEVLWYDIHLLERVHKPDCKNSSWHWLFVEPRPWMFASLIGAPILTESSHQELKVNCWRCNKTVALCEVELTSGKPRVVPKRICDCADHINVTAKHLKIQ
ncbi:unnamed protein product, partial [Medioppia subpectinata]